MTRLWLAPAVVLTAASFCAADEVHLRGGAILIGVVEDLGSEIRVTRRGQSVTIPREMVAKIVPAPLPEDLYDRRLREDPPADAEAHYELAGWCRRNGLPDEAREQHRRVLEHDPDHAAARAALGYRRLEDGRWATEAEIMTERGLVEHKGKWMTPEERDRAVRESELDRERREALRAARSALGDLRGRSEKRREAALAFLGASPWSVKLDLFVGALRRETVAIRRYVAAELGDCGDAAAVPGLVQAWLQDLDEEVRDAAGGSLERLASPEAMVNPVVKALFHDRHDVRIRAIRAAAALSDARTAEYLILLWQANASELLGGPPVPQTPAPGVVRKAHRFPDGTAVVVPTRMDIRHPMDELREQLKQRIQEELRAEIEAIPPALRRLAEEPYPDNLPGWQKWLETRRKGEGDK